MGILLLTVINLAVAGTGFAIAFVEGWRRHVYSIVWWCIVASMLVPFLAARTDGNWVLALVVVEVLAVFFGWFFSSILWSLDEIFDEAISSRLRRALVPEHWDGFFPSHYTPPRDHVRRIFVAVAASTGAVVFSLFGLGIFWTTLWEQLSFANVVVTSLLFVVGMFLVGPLQSYIYGIGAEGGARASDPSAELSELFSKGFDRRAAGRFALVALAGVQLGLLTNCVAATVQAGTEVVYYTVLTAALTPAVVSYYLSAALQLKPDRLTRAIVRPTLFAGAVVSYGIAFIFAAALALATEDGGDLSFFSFLLLMISPATAIPIALLVSAVTTLLPALVVAYAIERFRNRAPMVYVAAGLLIVGAAPTIALALYALIAEAPFKEDQFLPFLMGTAGWIVGLWSSGFPRLLREGKTADGAAAPA